MHVALFSHRYPPALGGAEAYAAKLAMHLREHGDTVTVWTTAAYHLEELWYGCPHPTTIDAAIRRYRPLSFPLRRYVLKALTLLTPPRVRAWLLPCNPICPAMLRAVDACDGPLDCVHAMAFPFAWPILCALRLARRRQVPFHLTPFLHLGDERTRHQYLQPALKWILLEADRVFVQTHLERDAVLRLGVPQYNVVLEGLGVDAGACTGGDRKRMRNQWNCDGEVVIGHLANLSFEKGSVDLLRACELLWKRGVDFRVVLAGADMANFRSFWNDFAFRERVTVMGRLSESSKRDFYAGIDAFALPSRTDSFGLVLLEAWANGKPNIAYNCGGPGELIHHGDDGLLAKTGDIADLAAMLERLIRDRRLSAGLGDNGQERVAEEFDWDSKLDIVRNQMPSLVEDYRLSACESLTPRLS